MMSSVSPIVGIQSPIPLIYLLKGRAQVGHGWDSVTYPLDILGQQRAERTRLLGFSHLSP